MRSIPPERILSAKRPAEIFGEDYREPFQRLRSYWHPDKNPHPKAVEVFNKIISLGAVAKVMAEGLREDAYSEVSHGTRRFQYLARYPFSLGLMWCDTRQVLFELADSDGDLAKQYCSMVKSRLQPPSVHKEMAAQFSPLLPRLEEMTRDGDKLHIRVGIFENLIPLSALLGYSKQIEPVHMAWITSRMLNCATYCEHLGVVNNAFTPDSFFVDPDSHAGFDIGGWFFSTESGGKLSALPKENLCLYPAPALSRKLAENRADLFMIKRTAAMLLGDSTGTGLKLDVDEVPQPLIGWLRQPPLATALQEYSLWENDILPRAFGRKKFCEFGINSQVILANIGG